MPTSCRQGVRAIPLLLLTTCRSPEGPPALTTLGGDIFGTTWSVKVVAGSVDPGRIDAAIRRELEAVDAVASTWREASEVGRFNRAATTAPLPASPALRLMVTQALDLAEASGGAFDPTILPLLGVYGFGPEASSAPPTAEALAAARARVGWQKLTLTPDGALVKALPDLMLDLSALAEGVAVDRVAEALEALGLTQFLVEVSGEISSRGRRPDGTLWRVGIDTPVEGPPGSGGSEAIVTLVDRAMATSGDYRQVKTMGADRVHHIIDPRTGESAEAGLTSVSVVAPTCAQADALATTLMVMGLEEGLPFLRRYAPAAEAFWIVPGPHGDFKTGHTAAFPLTSDPPPR